MLEKIIKIVKRSIFSIRLKLYLLSLFCMLTGAAYSQASLPKGAKLETIRFSKNKYNKASYFITGYVHKKQFVEGQQISLTIHNFGAYKYGIPNTFFNFNGYEHIKNEATLKGIYILRQNMPYVEGTITFKDYPLLQEKGLYMLMNSTPVKLKEQLLTAIPKKSDYLLYQREDIYYYRGYYVDNEKKYPLTWQKLSENSYLLKIEFDDRMLEAVANYEDLVKHGLSGDNFIESSQNVRLNYKNGNAFIGIVVKRNKGYRPYRGEIRFTTGEKYIGAISENGIYDGENFFVPRSNQGETIFADGTVAKGAWLDQYNLTSDEKEKLHKSCKSLTEMRNEAVRLFEEKQRKLQEEKIAKERTEQEKHLKEQQQKEQQKQEYISKYGAYYGTLISRRELDTGMSKEMVSEIWPPDFFMISKAVYFGQTIDTWEFSKEKMQRAIFNDGATLGDLFSINLNWGQIEPKIPKILIFTNNKLTEIYRYK